VNLLLDSHAVLWFLAGSERLSEAARSSIAEADRVYVSAMTIWELSTQAARGWLEAPSDLTNRLLDQGMLPLALEWEHARVVGGLPLHHRDPVDRMLVAQALVERLTIVSRDREITRYPVPVIEA
jgi:PIN domain nuclease of toxin-antitoxin system